MNPNDVNKIPRFQYLILLVIVALAFYIAFIPHQQYSYPVHIDEWVHMAYSEAMLTADSTTFTDPFFGRTTLGLSSNLEAGFHLFLSTLQQISGLSWPAIFRYFPSIIFSITVLSVYVLARRQGFGLEAAFFASLLPTTVGILGPAFLVPVSLGLLFTPLSLFIAYNCRTVWSYIILFIFTSFLLLAHAPSAICIVIILIPFILFNLKKNFMHCLGITLAMVIPFLAPFPWIFDLLLPTIKQLFTIPLSLSLYTEISPVIRLYGYLPIAIGILGVFSLSLRGGGKNYSLVFGLLALLVMLVLSFTFHYGIPIMYVRGLMFMLLMISIVAGAGLMVIKNLKFPEKFIFRVRLPLSARNVGYLLCVILVGLTLTIIIPERQGTPYYHPIDDEDYQAFVWIKENVEENYKVAILDPWKATAFTAITGKNIYTKIHSYPMAIDEKAYKFLQDGCTDTNFLIENNISIVYTRGSCNNPALVKQEMGSVYLFSNVQESD